MHETNQAKES